MNWKLPAVAVAVLVAVANLVPSQTSVEPSQAKPENVAVNNNQSGIAVANGAALMKQLASLQEAATQASTQISLQAAPPWAALANGEKAGALLREFDKLRALPPGEAATALMQQIEDGLTRENSAAYVHALLSTEHPAVERAAMTALARSADAQTMIELAGYYGSMAPEQRGRVLRVFEDAQNPAAVAGLATIIAADTGEKRSPLMMSALYGIANTGQADSVQYLLAQMSTDNAEYALMALERVRSEQGLEMIRAAAQGNKDSEPIASAYQPALRRIADATAGPENTKL